MKPPKAVKFRDLKRMFARFDIVAQRTKSVGHRRKRHYLLIAPDGTKFPIPAVRDGDDIARTYVEAARRKFHLRPEDGISNKDFYRLGK